MLCISGGLLATGIVCYCRRSSTELDEAAHSLNTVIIPHPPMETPTTESIVPEPLSTSLTEALQTADANAVRRSIDAEPITIKHVAALYEDLPASIEVLERIRGPVASALITEFGLNNYEVVDKFLQKHAKHTASENAKITEDFLYEYATKSLESAPEDGFIKLLRFIDGYSKETGIDGVSKETESPMLFKRIFGNLQFFQFEDMNPERFAQIFKTLAQQPDNVPSFVYLHSYGLLALADKTGFLDSYGAELQLAHPENTALRSAILTYITEIKAKQ